MSGSTFRMTVIAVTLAVGGAALGAQTTIGGRVIDRASHKPLRTIQLAVLPDTGSDVTVVARSETDTTGIFYVDVPAGGKYRLLFGLPGGSSYLSPAFAVAAGDFSQAEYLVDVPRVYFEFEVEKPTAQIPNGVAPRYPDDMREGGVEGEVLAQFVVDAAGLPVLSTFKVLKSTHDSFVSAVRDALPRMRFYPATVHGVAVRQLVQMPFVFSLNRTPPLIFFPPVQSRRPPEVGE